MLLPAIPPVDHAETGHAQGGAVFINGNGVRNGIRLAPFMVEVNKRPDPPFLAEAIRGIVVMRRVQADIPDRDIWMDSFKFPEGDDGADAVVAPGIQEADMQGQVNTGLHYGNRAYRGCAQNKRPPHHCPSGRPDRRNGVCRNSR